MSFQYHAQCQLRKELHDACGEENDISRAVELLGQGADLTFLVNGLSWGGNNALHVASRYGRVSIVSMLLGKGQFSTRETV
jgi:threonine dehydrogenase-like Zn-dependent dehydrogenase